MPAATADQEGTEPDGCARMRGQTAERFRRTRHCTLELAKPLSAEDQQVQSMPDASPTKWHLAHTTWFFETFVLETPEHRQFAPAFSYLFNSYYESLGARHPRPSRGVLTRPSLEQIHQYRCHVDAAVEATIQTADEALFARLAPLIELGLQHEQQHQELILMDIKHLLSCNPLAPAYAPCAEPAALTTHPRPAEWIGFPGGLREIGAFGAGFAFDNELPRHRVWLEPFSLHDRLVTAGEWLAFMLDDGYTRPELWLSDGWAVARESGWQSPLYWMESDRGWELFTLRGRRQLDPEEPVCHVSFYEADAYARWRELRLPTEAEWEYAAECSGADAATVTALHPRPGGPQGAMRQLFGELWQWTASPYVGYPRFRPAAGAIGEYNGKFMSGQMVLRGSACVTPPGHARASYRNFYPPAARWPFTGVRLAKDD